MAALTRTLILEVV